MKFSGVDATSIAAFSGKQLTPASITYTGLDPVPVGTSGLLMTVDKGSASGAWDPDLLNDYANPINMFQLWSNTDVVDLQMNSYHMFALTSQGVLYSAGNGTNSSQIGRSITQSTPVTEFHQCATNVAQLSVHQYGAMIIKTDGTLHWCGSIGSYTGNTTPPGANNTYSNNTFTQWGSDTDWHYIECSAFYPNCAVAIKGTNKYLYGIGIGYTHGLSSGSTGTLTDWTRFKSNSTTDLAESFSMVRTFYGATLAISTSGKLYSCGESNYGITGTGSATDVVYMSQVGTATDHEDVSMTRFNAYVIRSGQLYGSSSSNGFSRVYGGSSRAFQRIGIASNWVTLRQARNNSSGGRHEMFVKNSNGDWYVGAGYLEAKHWPRYTSTVYWTYNTLEPLDEVLQHNTSLVARTTDVWIFNNFAAGTCFIMKVQDP